MYPPVVTKDSTAVQVEVQAAYRSIFPDADPLFVPRVFVWAIDSFSGRYDNYAPIDARYHDFEHTMQGTLCMARLLRGRHEAGGQPPLTEPLFQLGIVAILLHDTGYLKQQNDRDGTGAKYTAVHVDRSAEFAARLLGEKGYSAKDICSVQNMIRCTGVDADLSAIPFQSDLEKLVGYALGTADLLGQMSAPDYVEKLPVLYSEFAEAAQHNTNEKHVIAFFSSAEDLMTKTPAFWKNYVRPRLEHEFVGLYRFLNNPYPDGPNSYVERVEANMERLRQRLPATRK